MAKLIPKDVSDSDYDSVCGGKSHRQLNLRVPSNLIDSLDAMALDTGETKGVLLGKALMLYLRDHKYLNSKIKIERV